jgi:hypothetical protein
MKRPLYQALAARIGAVANCEKGGNIEWLAKHKAAALALTKQYMPSGSGIDCGTTLQLDDCTSEKLVFFASFHHMDEQGGYDGWSEHFVTVRASLQFGIDIKISGRDRNDIKEYLDQVFHDALTSEIDE